MFNTEKLKKTYQIFCNGLGHFGNRSNRRPDRGDRHLQQVFLRIKEFRLCTGGYWENIIYIRGLRSSLRAAIGYDDADAIATVVEQHAQNKTQFQEYFAQVEHTIVSEDGRKTYDEIEALLDEYWALTRKSWISAQPRTGNYANRRRIWL